MTAAGAWRRENAEWLVLALERLRLVLNRRALWLGRAHDGRGRSVGWLLDAEEPGFYERDPSSSEISAAIAAVDCRLAEQARRTEAAGRPPALDILARLAGLSAFEREVLLLAAAPSLDAAFERAFAELQDDARRTYATLQLALGLFARNGADRVLAADCLLESRALRRLVLVEVDGAPLLSARLTVDERIADHLRGVNRPDRRVAALLGDVPHSLACDRTAAAAAAVTTPVDPSGRWATVNLVGTVADGAADVAALACARLGLELRALDLDRLAAHDARERDRLVALLAREAQLGGLALLLDMAEGVADRSVVDALIRAAPALLMVVSQKRWPGDHAAAVVRIGHATRAEQVRLWRSALEAHGADLDGAVDAVVQQFDFGPPAIASTVARVAGGGAITPPALWRACREHVGVALDDLADLIEPCYGWEDIVVGDDVRAQLTELAAQVRQRARVYEAWGFGAQLGRGRGITALFAGASGTGKTMAAEILARDLALDLYRVDLAGVVSKYIGETEKNLRRVFDAAERSGAILFFDEADALFGTRSEVRDSHDRYANVEINYLLQRMEDYGGLAILATNRRAALDPAFLRRLRFVIEFPFPEADDRRRIWERVFPVQAELDGIELGWLSRLELTGGSIRSIALGAAFLAAEEGAPIGMPQLARAAARELEKLSMPVGAAEFGDYYAAVAP